MDKAALFPVRPAMFIAGDDESRKPAVLRLVAKLGFEASIPAHWADRAPARSLWHAMDRPGSGIVGAARALPSLSPIDHGPSRRPRTKLLLGSRAWQKWRNLSSLARQAARFRSIRAALYVATPCISELPPQGSLRAWEALYFPHAHFNHTPLSTGGDAVIRAPWPTSEAGFRRVADRHLRPRLCVGRVNRGPRGGHFGTVCRPTELGSLASAPDGAARISAEHRQTGFDLPTRIHALPGLRLYRAEQQRLSRGSAGLRLLAGLWLRLSLRRVPRLRIWRRSLSSVRWVPRLRIWRRSLSSLRWVPRWRLSRSSGFSRRSQARPFQPGDRTYGRLRPEIIWQSELSIAREVTTSEAETYLAEAAQRGRLRDENVVGR